MDHFDTGLLRGWSLKFQLIQVREWKLVSLWYYYTITVIYDYESVCIRYLLFWTPVAYNHEKVVQITTFN